MKQTQTTLKPWQEELNLGWLIHSLIWVLEKAQALGLKFPDFSEGRLLRQACKKNRLIGL